MFQRYVSGPVVCRIFAAVETPGNSWQCGNKVSEARTDVRYSAAWPGPFSDVRWFGQ